MITYFQIFQGRMAPKVGRKSKIDELDFAMFLTWAKDGRNDDDTYEEMDQYIVHKMPILFGEALTDFGHTNRPSAILNAIKKKGYWAGTGEEGSFGFATEGHEEECKIAVLEIEARQTCEDDIDW